MAEDEKPDDSGKSGALEQLATIVQDAAEDSIGAAVGDPDATPKA